MGSSVSRSTAHWRVPDIAKELKLVVVGPNTPPLEEYPAVRCSGWYRNDASTGVWVITLPFDDFLNKPNRIRKQLRRAALDRHSQISVHWITQGMCTTAAGGSAKYDVLTKGIMSDGLMCADIICNFVVRLLVANPKLGSFSTFDISIINVPDDMCFALCGQVFSDISILGRIYHCKSSTQSITVAPISITE